MKCNRCSRALHFLILSEMKESLYSFSRQISPFYFKSFYPEKRRTFGAMLRKARMDIRLTAKELSRMLGVTEDTIYNWEVRQVRPSGDNL